MESYLRAAMERAMKVQEVMFRLPGPISSPDRQPSPIHNVTCT
jgi:hypothetical protein